MKYISEKYLKERTEFEVDLSQWEKKNVLQEQFIINLVLMLFIILVSTLGMSIIINRLKKLDKDLTKKMITLIGDNNIEVFYLEMQIPNAFNRGTAAVYYTTKLKKLLTEKQLMSVLCHEYGHYKEKHVFKQLTGHVIIGLGTFTLVSYLIKERKLNPVIGLFLSLLTPIMSKSIVNLLLSKPEEYVADTYSNKFGLGKEFAESLKKLQQVQRKYICKKLGKEQCDLKLKRIELVGTHPSFKNRIARILKNNAVYNIIRTGDTNIIVKFLQRIKARFTGS